MNSPIPRRTFIGGSFLAWPSWSLAQRANLPDFSFVVVSDTHLGRAESNTPARQWAQTAREIDASTGDFVLHLGDVVDSGKENQYPIYLETRRTIRKPVHEIPGNHDPQELFAKHLRKEIDFSFENKGVRFLLINNTRTDSHDGFIGARQLTWLGDQCADAVRKNEFIIIAMHVPAHQNGGVDRGWYVKPKEGQVELYALLDRHKDRVLALLHGHFHNGVRGWNDHGPLQEVLFPSALYNQNRQFAERKAPGFYLNELRPGFVRVEISPKGMMLRYKAVGVEGTTDRECPLTQFQK